MSEIKHDNMEFRMLSALGMLFVLSGHYSVSTLSLGGIYRYDTFHMPMFIFISGYFFKESSGNSLKNYGIFVKKKIFTLLIPYYIWNVVYYIIAFILQKYTQMNICSKSVFSVSSFLLNPFKLANGATYNIAAWFLMALFLCHLIFISIYIILKRLIPKKYDIALGIVIFIYSYLALHIAASEWQSEWRILLCRSGYLLFYYLLGYYYKKYFEFFDEKINDIYSLIFNIGLSLLVIRAFGDNTLICYDMSFYGDCVLPYFMIRAILGILFWVRISKIITPRLRDNKVMYYYSTHTFSLMMHQGIAGILINRIVIFLLNKENYLDEFRTNIWFNAFNKIQRAWMPILVSIVILVLVYLYEKIRFIFKNILKVRCCSK